MTDNSTVLVTKTEFARQIDVSPTRVGQLIRQGKLTVATPDGRLDLDKALGQYLRNTDAAKREADRARPDRQGKRTGLVDGPPAATQQLRTPDAGKANEAAPATPEGSDHRSAREEPQHQFNFSISRAQKEHFNAERARIEVEARAGKLVSVESVADHVFGVARTLRDQLLALPPRLAHRVPREDLEFVQTEVDRIIREMEEAVARIAGGPSKDGHSADA